jgi:DNA-binding NtrC family response regulator
VVSDPTRQRQESARLKGPVLVLLCDGATTTVPLVEGRPLVVGRSDEADVEIADPDLSRRHAAFTLRDGSVWVEDLGSTNGTEINGRAITRALLSAGDEVVLGRTQAIVRHPASAAPIESDDDLERWLDEVRDQEQSLCLVLVRSGRGTDISEWLPPLRPLLSAASHVCIYGRNRLLVAVTDLGGGWALARDARRKLPAVDLRFGLASSTAPRVEPHRMLGDAEERCSVATRDQPIADASPTKADGSVLVTPALAAVFAEVDRVARSSLPVLVIGETGVGKEIVARRVHAASGRPGAFVAVNCGALPAQLLESIFFGHEAGAFTGAAGRRPGLLETAAGGTLFLDELWELDARSSAFVAGVVGSRSYRRLGSTEERAIDVRVTAATTRVNDASAPAVRVWQRLAGVSVEIPSLRERAGDVQVLAELFLRQVAASGETRVHGVSAEAMDALVAYRWPGNVRQLKNTIHRAALMSDGPTLRREDLPESLTGEAPRTSEKLRDRVRAYEAHVIREALARHGGSQAAAARELGVPARTLSNRIRALGISTD